MAVTLQTISLFNGTGGMVLNAKGDGFEAAGIGHRLKTFFGFSDAVKKNADTVQAIRDAILLAAATEPAFSTTDLKATASRLLQEVRTDVVVDASRIKGIVSELTSLTARAGVVLDKRVDMHLAASGLPPELSNCAEQVTFISQQVVRRHDARIDPTKRTDVGLAVDFVANRCSFAVAQLSSLPERHSKEIADFVGKRLGQYLLRSDGTLRPEQEVKDAGAFCCQASRGAYRLAREKGITDLYGEIEFAKPFEMAAAEFVTAVGRPVKPDFFGKIRDYVWNLPVKDYRSVAREVALDVRFGRRGERTPELIRAAITKIAKQMVSEGPLLGDDGKPVFGDDVKAFEALERYMAKLVGLRLSESFGVMDGLVCDMYQAQSLSEVFEKAVRDAIIKAKY